MKHFRINHKPVFQNVENSAREMIYWGYLKLNEEKRFFTLTNDLQIVQVQCRISEKSTTFSGKAGFDNLVMEVKFDGSDKWVERWFTNIMSVAIAQKMMIAGEVGQALYKEQRKYDDMYMKMVDEYNAEISK